MIKSKDTQQPSMEPDQLQFSFMKEFSPERNLRRNLSMRIKDLTAERDYFDMHPNEDSNLNTRTSLTEQIDDLYDRLSVIVQREQERKRTGIL